MDASLIKNCLASFVPLFVAVDAVGILPLFASLTVELDDEEKKRVIRQSTATALALALGFVLVGKAVFRLLGITMAEFMMAGDAGAKAPSKVMSLLLAAIAIMLIRRGIQLVITAAHTG